MNTKPILDKALSVPYKGDRDFFLKWMYMLQSKHGLTPRQMQLAAEFLYNRHELSKVINDKSVLEDMCVNIESKKKVRATLGIKESLFNVMWRRLKMAGFIENRHINQIYIPNLNGNSYKLGILFIKK